MNSLSLLDVILVGGILQGVFLAVVLTLLTERNKSANKILAFILLISVLMLSGRLLLVRFHANWLTHLAILADTTIFLFGPLVYTYVRRLAFMEVPNFSLRKIHYILPLVHLLYVFWYFILDAQTIISLNEKGIFLLTGFLAETLGMISLGYYLFLSFKVLAKYRKSSKEELSNPQGLTLFLRTFLIILTSCFFFWFVSYLNSMFLRFDIPFLSYNSLWITIPVFIYGVGYFSLRQPEIFRIPVRKDKTGIDRLKPSEIKQLQKRLHFFMNEEKAYLDPDLTLKSLSEKLNTTTNNLSWLLNQVYQEKFYDYINSYRVEAFLEKVRNNEHEVHTLLAMALDVGFSSKTTFNKVFKSQTGMTPTAYIKEKFVA